MHKKLFWYVAPKSIQKEMDGSLAIVMRNYLILHLLLKWDEKKYLTLAINDTLYDFFQAYHVDELTIGCARQEVKQGSRRFWGWDLQEGLFQLFAKSQFGCSLWVGSISHGAGARKWWGHSVHGPWLNMGSKVHVDGRGCCALTGNRRTWLLK